MTKTEKGSRKAAFSFLEANTSAPLPGLAASAANRIPRWLLMLIVLLYVGHGLFYRDPWRGDDMLGLALARTTAEGLLRGDFPCCCCRSWVISRGISRGPYGLRYSRSSCCQHMSGRQSPRHLFPFICWMILVEFR